MTDWKALGVGAVTLGVNVVAVVCECEPTPREQDVVMLEDAWRTHHPGKELPAPCRVDQMDSMYLEVDPSPGDEIVIASDRLGIAMFSNEGDLLAFRESDGCRDDKLWRIDNALRGSSEHVRFDGLAFRPFHMMICAKTTLLVRDGDALVPLVRYYEPGNSVWCTETVATATPTLHGVLLQVESHRDWAHLDDPPTRCLVTVDGKAGECAFLVEK